MPIAEKDLMSGLKFQRLEMLMEPEPGNAQEVEGVLNPAAARGPDGELYLFPRLVGRGNYSRIGIARVLFNKVGDPVGVERLGIAVEPEADYERRPDGGGGCEDPRITFVEPLQSYMMTYTAFSPEGPRIALALSKDLFHWKRLGLATLNAAEAEQFLHAAKEICPEYHPLFLMALRAGLRRGELVAIQWGDIQFGKDENDANRFIVVQHNYVRREHTTTKSHKNRRVDMSRELRRTLLEVRDKRLLEAFLEGKNDISDELVFPSPDGAILDPDNLYHRYFLPVLTKAGVRKIRLHDLRHTFGSLLIQNGASIVYVKEQMGHSSIQVTVDTYSHLIPGANVNFVDRLDEVLTEKTETSPRQSATPAQQPPESETEIPSEVADLIGGGGWTRTNDLRIMRPSL